MKVDLEPGKKLDETKGVVASFYGEGDRFEERVGLGWDDGVAERFKAV
jgi:hypothetical protein